MNISNDLLSEFLAASQGAHHPFASRAGEVQYKIPKRHLPATVTSGGPPVPKQPHLAVTPGAVGSPGAETGAHTGGSHPPDVDPRLVQLPTDMRQLDCPYLCGQTFSYYPAERELAVQDRALHMRVKHQDSALAPTSHLVQIKILEDDGQTILTEGRYLSYPASRQVAARFHPLKLEPVRVDYDFTALGLTILSTKPVELLHDRSTQSLNLRMFTNQALMRHDKRQLAKCSFQDSGNITFTADPDPPVDVTDSMNAIVNFVGALALIDPMDKSAFSLLKVFLDLNAEGKMSAAESEHLFSIYLSRRCAAAVSGQPLPSYSDIKSAYALSGPAPRPPKKPKSDRSDQRRKDGGVYCYEFASKGSCSLSTGVSCQRKGRTYLHSCSKKLPGGQKCNGFHAPSACPNK